MSEIKTVKVTVDGQQVEVPAGATALQAATDAAFKPGGALAGARPEYQRREAQADLAARIAIAIDTGGSLLAEAGTGIGKTFAYLVPALLARRRVLIATPTNLIAIARTVAAVWRQEKLAGEARQIGQLGREPHRAHRDQQPGGHGRRQRRRATAVPTATAPTQPTTVRATYATASPP